MSDVELLEVVAAFQANGISTFTVYISFTFAFLMVGYFAGPKLNLTQAIAVSILYVLSSSATIFNMITILQAMDSLLAEPNRLDQYLLWDIRLWLIFMPAVLVLGVIGSLYFLYAQRRGT